MLNNTSLVVSDFLPKEAIKDPHDLRLLLKVSVLGSLVDPLIGFVDQRRDQTERFYMRHDIQDSSPRRTHFFNHDSPGMFLRSSSSQLFR